MVDATGSPFTALYSFTEYIQRFAILVVQLAREAIKCYFSALIPSTRGSNFRLWVRV